MALQLLKGRIWALLRPPRLTRPAVDLASILLGGPKLDDGVVDVLAEIEAERKADFGRVVDLEAGTRSLRQRRGITEVL
jgi:hypothetical protein